MDESQLAMANRLRLAREAAGYGDGTAAARAIGQKPPTYLGHENGSRGFRDDASRYADFFKVNLEWLLTGRGAMKRALEPAGVAEDKTLFEPEARPRIHPAKPQEAAVVDLDRRSWPMDLPVLGISVCGKDGGFELNGQTVDYVRRPPRLSGIKDAYALYASGESMVPWRKPGKPVLVHPHQHPNIGDHVVVQMKPKRSGDPGATYIKLLVRRTERELVLAQYNPPEEIRLKMADVQYVHRVIELEDLIGI